jgi:hypothetical protein
VKSTFDGLGKDSVHWLTVKFPAKASGWAAVLFFFELR